MMFDITKLSMEELVLAHRELSEELYSRAKLRPLDVEKVRGLSAKLRAGIRSSPSRDTDPTDPGNSR